MVSTLKATACFVRSVTSVSDRKSTRLNSSHLVISYAVFCLKKKKIKPISLSITVSTDDLVLMDRRRKDQIRDSIISESWCSHDKPCISLDRCSKHYT